MGGRNTYAAGKNAPFTYKTVGFFHGIKVLEGLGGKHNLPEEAHGGNETRIQTITFCLGR